MDRIYDVKMKRLALLLLPTAWRQKGLGALLYALVGHAGEAVAELQRIRAEQADEAKRNGQVCQLRRLLTEKATMLSGDAGMSKMITIVDADSGGELPFPRVKTREKEEWLMIPERATGKALPVARRALERTNCDFWVNVPRGLLDAAQEQQLRALTDRYKLTTKRYEINYINAKEQ